MAAFVYVMMNTELHNKWLGPYKVIQKINEINYTIKHLNRRSRRIIVHINMLKRCFMRVNDENMKNEHEIK